MPPNRRERDWPVPDAIHQIKNALVKENDSATNLLAVSSNRGLGEVTLANRDGAVRTLRFLKFWFCLSTSVFLSATNILDRFLTKMKVQKRYLACLVVSCFNVATKMHKRNVDPKILVNVTRSKCSIKDMDRMSEIVYKKLDLESGKQLINVYNYLNQFLNLLECVAAQSGIESLFNIIIKKELLFTRLEVIMCDSECASAKPSVIALALIQSEFERFLSNQVHSKSSYYYSFEMLQLLTSIVDLQLICLIVPAEFTSCQKKVTIVLNEYDNRRKSNFSQNLKWRCSSRSIYTLKPHFNYLNALYTIPEE